MLINKAKKERFVWLDITITLAALQLMAYFYYGLHTVVTAFACVAFSFVCEYISVRLSNKKFTADNLTCVSDGLIISLMMPAGIDYKIPVMACIFANVVGKNIFGGRKNIIFSPAAVGYLFALTSWKDKLNMYPLPFARIGIREQAKELAVSASYTFNTTGKLSLSDYDILLGNFCGGVGTVSILLLLISAVILLFRRDISLGAFVGAVAGNVFMSVVCPVTSDISDTLKYVFTTNMTLFATIFIISDIRTTPHKSYYSFYYGLFTALISYALLLTTGIENLSVIIAVLLTPLALALKKLEDKIKYLKSTGTIVETVKQNNELSEEIAADISVENDDISEIASDAIKEINEISGNNVSAVSFEAAQIGEGDISENA